MIERGCAASFFVCLLLIVVLVVILGMRISDQVHDYAGNVQSQPALQRQVETPTPFTPFPAQDPAASQKSEDPTACYTWQQNASTLGEPRNDGSSHIIRWTDGTTGVIRACPNGNGGFFWSTDGCLSQYVNSIFSTCQILP